MQAPRVDQFRGTELEPAFAYVRDNLEAMTRPRLTFYWRFLTTSSRDAHFFGGIWPEVLGTLYLTIGAMLFAIPIGVIAAIYLCEYARPTRTVSLLRSCISTLAGVPSIVFGLFGLAFFLNTIRRFQIKKCSGRQPDTGTDDFADHYPRRGRSNSGGTIHLQGSCDGAGRRALANSAARLFCRPHCRGF